MSSNWNNVQTCTVTAVDGLNVRTEPYTSSVVVNTYPKGSILNFVAVVYGDDLGGNPRWGYSQQGHYFWLGGTNRPNG